MTSAFTLVGLGIVAAWLLHQIAKAQDEKFHDLFPEEEEI